MRIPFINTAKAKELEILKQEFDNIKIQIEEASGFVKEIEKGNLQIDVSEQLSKSEFGTTLISMQNHLAKIATEEKERTWVNAGLAKFSDILRNKESLDLKDLADDILMNLVKYVNANQGLILVLEDNSKGEQYLESIACYAYNRKKFLNKRVELGEGLAGQCILEKEMTYLTEIPANYVTITSGLGESTPKCILICPLLINEKIFGVIELASFEEIQPYKIEFINRLAENIASSIKNVKDTERTQGLLNASQQQSEELRAQEEEMRQNMEEMQATQEEMGRKSEELAKVAAETDGMLKGINATMATIEFTPDGNVTTANANFLSTMKYTLADIKGKHHKKFVPKEIIESEEYQSFWTNLASGISNAGIFKRIDSKGEIVWLNAIYNPIFDATGKVVKVVKFATDITVEQEMLAENKGIINGIDTTMATIEFTPGGFVTDANNNFLLAMKCTLPDIKGKHHKNFVPEKILDSEEYKSFWPNLASGIPNSGIFERINSLGKTVWLNAIYNPILNAEGKVVKVVKFATDITAEKEKEFEIKQMLEESKAQEEEIRQNMEEMQATQEEMERKNIEIAKFAAESEGILKGIDATMATIEFTPDGIVTDANENFLSAMKCTLPDIKGKHHKNFVPKKILDSEEYKSFWANLAAGIPNSGIFERINSKGKTVWLNAIYNPILDENGKVVKVVKFATDITAEQEMLAENKGIMSGINATMATIEFTPNGIVTDANDNFLSVMKCTLSEIKGKHHKTFVPKNILNSEEYKSFWTNLSAGISNSGVFERIDSKGQTVWLNAIYNPIFDAEGKIVKVMKFATDITVEKEKEFEIKQLLEESKAQEEEIRQNMEEMQAIQEGAETIANNLKVREDVFGLTTIISESDTNGNIIYTNEKFEKVSQFSKEEIMGQPQDVFHHSDMPKELLAFLWKTLKKGETFQGIIKNKTKDGSYYWVDACYVPVNDKNGKLSKYIGSMYPIKNDLLALNMYNEQMEKLGLPVLGRSAK